MLLITFQRLQTFIFSSRFYVFQTFLKALVSSFLHLCFHLRASQANEASVVLAASVCMSICVCLYVCVSVLTETEQSLIRINV